MKQKVKERVPRLALQECSVPDGVPFPPVGHRIGETAKIRDPGLISRNLIFARLLAFAVPYVVTLYPFVLSLHFGTKFVGFRADV